MILIFLYQCLFPLQSGWSQNASIGFFDYVFGLLGFNYVIEGAVISVIFCVWFVLFNYLWTEVVASKCSQAANTPDEFAYLHTVWLTGCSRFHLRSLAEQNTCCRKHKWRCLEHLARPETIFQEIPSIITNKPELMILSWFVVIDFMVLAKWWEAG